MSIHHGFQFQVALQNQFLFSCYLVFHILSVNQTGSFPSARLSIQTLIVAYLQIGKLFQLFRIVDVQFPFECLHL